MLEDLYLIVFCKDQRPTLLVKRVRSIVKKSFYQNHVPLEALFSEAELTELTSVLRLTDKEKERLLAAQERTKTLLMMRPNNEPWAKRTSEAVSETEGPSLA